TSDGPRKKFDVRGPFFGGWEIYHRKGSSVDPNKIFASQTSGWFGQIIQRSDDGGKTSHQPGTPKAKAPKPEGAAHDQSEPTPGAGGLGLHTIVIVPTNLKRMYIAISASGAFRTDDGGNTCKPINRGLPSEYIPDPAASVGHCVHRITLHKSRPNTLFMQKHW